VQARSKSAAAAYVRRDPRDERLDVRCESQQSKACRGSYTASTRAVSKNRSRNAGRFICLPCSRFEKNRGRRNPNARYIDLRDDFFREIDSEGKAYLLGWIASDGSITRGTIAIFVHPKDASIVDQWKAILGSAMPTRKLRDLVGISLSSQQMVEDVCRWLQIVPGKKSASVGFPQLGDESLQWAYLRGVFDGDGAVVAPTQDRGPRCCITSGSKAFRDALRAWCPVRASYSRDKIEWAGVNALDFLGRLYADATFRLPRKHDLYLDWCVWQPGLKGGSRHGRGASFRWVATDPSARPPSKVRVSDSGYDLTVIKRAGVRGMVEFFDTCIKVQPDFGWYFDVAPRSSLAKSGYIMANSIGVIDRAYTGTVLIALIKIDPSAGDLELPARIAQLIPRPIVHLQIEEVDSLDETARGAGGFGSTGR
jgi:deoxyuridine 5'-triphosphate nucleotidohydrolase